MKDYLKEGDVIVLGAGTKVYAMIPEMFAYENRKLSTKLTHSEVEVGAILCNDKTVDQDVKDSISEIVEELKNEDAAEPTEVVEEVVEEVAEEAAEEVVEVAEECCDEPCDDCEVKNVTPADEAREELKKYMNAFGNDVGAEWFLNGVTWEDCQNRQLEQLKNEAESLRSELAELKEQNADLTGRVEAAVKASGEVSPVSNSGDEPETATKSGLASKIQMPN